MAELDLGWLADAVDSSAVVAAAEAGDTRLVRAALGLPVGEAAESHEWMASVLHALAWDEIVSDPNSARSRALSRQAFKVSRGLIDTADPAPSEAGEVRTGDEVLLRLACLAWLGDETSLAQRLLSEASVDVVLNQDLNWGDRVRSAAMSTWLLLLRKRGWEDLDAISNLHDAVEGSKAAEERKYVFGMSTVDEEGAPASDGRGRAWEMVCHYQLIAAARMAASYLVSGSVGGPRGDSFEPRSSIEPLLDRARAAANAAGIAHLEDLSRLLGVAVNRMLENSVWSVARGANPLTRRFVESLVDRARSRPLLELLPPQRQALAGAGLARGGKRSIVVSMPTSAGKTLIAQFRILEALNAFHENMPWVAYIAPSRALVNQVTRRLRHDFAPLGIRVEQVSPALEIDGTEEAMMLHSDPGEAFQVLVATPEKLDLMLRSKWAEKVGRPLTLIVVDEAHTIEQSVRGVRLELLLATINREVRDAQFLLLTPFIDNAEQIAAWLDPASFDGVKLELDWSPNDRIVGLAKRTKGSKAGDFTVRLDTLHTTRETLSSEVDYQLGENRPLGLTWSKAKSVGKLAAATSHALEGRGSTITIVQKPGYTWAIAETLAGASDIVGERGDDLLAAQAIVIDELGAQHPMVRLLTAGVGVHHAGISPELRVLIEWLVERGELRHLVATTTIAAGVNFPVANVVLASHQYPYGQDMGASEFWNLAGRAGRVDQGKVGIIALASEDDARSDLLENFVARQVTHLNSSLVQMVKSAVELSGRLDLSALAYRDEWSAFVQFLSHSYREIGRADLFAQETEALLRGTLGFQVLRAESVPLATELVRAVREYGLRMEGAPLALVDATGFSLESVSGALGRLRNAAVTEDTWAMDLFGADKGQLAAVLGVMLDVPELRGNLIDEVGGQRGPGRFLAEVVSDWVNGISLREIADKHYARPGEDPTVSLTRAAQRVFRNIAPTVAWGLSAMQSLTVSGNDEAAAQRYRNLPAYAFYGVNSEPDIALRLVGVPRGVTPELRTALGLTDETLAPQTARARLRGLTEEQWTSALGAKGTHYRRAWTILDGAT